MTEVWARVWVIVVGDPRGLRRFTPSAPSGHLPLEGEIGCGEEVGWGLVAGLGEIPATERGYDGSVGDC